MNHTQSTPYMHVESPNIVPPHDAMDDTQTVLVSSHVIITDKKTGKILLNKRGS